MHCLGDGARGGGSEALHLSRHRFRCHPHSQLAVCGRPSHHAIPCWRTARPKDPPRKSEGDQRFMGETPWVRLVGPLQSSGQSSPRRNQPAAAACSLPASLPPFPASTASGNTVGAAAYGQHVGILGEKHAVLPLSHFLCVCVCHSVSVSLRKLGKLAQVS